MNNIIDSISVIDEYVSEYENEILEELYSLYIKEMTILEYCSDENDLSGFSVFNEADENTTGFQWRRINEKTGKKENILKSIFLFLGRLIKYIIEQFKKIPEIEERADKLNRNVIELKAKCNSLDMTLKQERNKNEISNNKINEKIKSIGDQLNKLSSDVKIDKGLFSKAIEDMRDLNIELNYVRIPEINKRLANLENSCKKMDYNKKKEFLVMYTAMNDKVYTKLDIKGFYDWMQESMKTISQFNGDVVLTIKDIINGDKDIDNELINTLSNISNDIKKHVHVYDEEKNKFIVEKTEYSFKEFYLSYKKNMDLLKSIDEQISFLIGTINNISKEINNDSDSKDSDSKDSDSKDSDSKDSDSKKSTPQQKVVENLLNLLLNLLKKVKDGNDMYNDIISDIENQYNIQDEIISLMHDYVNLKPTQYSDAGNMPVNNYKQIHIGTDFQEFVNIVKDFNKKTNCSLSINDDIHTCFDKLKSNDVEDTTISELIYELKKCYEDRYKMIQSRDYDAKTNFENEIERIALDTANSIQGNFQYLRDNMCNGNKRKYTNIIKLYSVFSIIKELKTDNLYIDNDNYTLSRRIIS